MAVMAMMIVNVNVVMMVKTTMLRMARRETEGVSAQSDTRVSAHTNNEQDRRCRQTHTHTHSRTRRQSDS